MINKFQDRVASAKYVHTESRCLGWSPNKAHAAAGGRLVHIDLRITEMREAITIQVTGEER